MNRLPLNSPLGAMRENPVSAPAWAIALAAAAGAHGLAAYLYFANPEPPPEPAPPPDDELLVMLTPPAPPATEAAAPPPPPPPPPDIELPDPPAEEPIVQAERAQDAPPPAEITARRFAEPDEEPVRRASAVSEARDGSDGPQFTPEQYRSYVDYVRSVRQRYVREVRYPPRAERDRVEGVGVLQIRVNRSGRIESWSIRQSAGDPQLDAELERCARRVRRVDPIPENIPADTLNFDIPIRFTIVN